MATKKKPSVAGGSGRGFTWTDDADLERQLIEKWTKIRDRTRPTDREKVKDLIAIAYQVHERETPPITWHDSPFPTGEWIEALPNKDVFKDCMSIGPWDVDWIATLERQHLLGKLEADTPNPEWLLNLAEEAHAVLFGPDFCFCCEWPTEVHVNARGELHRDGGPARVYKDGWKFFVLDGQAMPRRIVETPAELIPVEWFLEEENTDVRSAIIKKLGPARTLELMEATEQEREAGMYTQDNPEYILFNVDLKDVVGRALKIQDASTPGKFYIEWVPEECDTITKACLWRNEDTVLPHAKS